VRVEREGTASSLARSGTFRSMSVTRDAIWVTLALFVACGGQTRSETAATTPSPGGAGTAGAHVGGASAGPAGKSGGGTAGSGGDASGAAGGGGALDGGGNGGGATGGTNVGVGGNGGSPGGSPGAAGAGGSKCPLASATGGHSGIDVCDECQGTSCSAGTECVASGDFGGPYFTYCACAAGKMECCKSALFGAPWGKAACPDVGAKVAAACGAGPGCASCCDQSMPQGTKPSTWGAGCADWCTGPFPASCTGQWAHSACLSACDNGAGGYQCGSGGAGGNGGSAGAGG
jgi:hypothetical protein